jgi:hypothetical protein
MPTNKYRVPVILDKCQDLAKKRATEEGCSLSEYIRRLIVLDCNRVAGSGRDESAFENKKTNTV